MQLNVVISGIEDPLIMVVHRHGEDDLCPVLSDNIFIQLFLDLGGLGQRFKAYPVAVVIMHRGLKILADYAHAKLNTFVTDICTVARNKSADLILRFAAEGAADTLSFIGSCHVYTSKNKSN